MMLLNYDTFTIYTTVSSNEYIYDSELIYRFNIWYWHVFSSSFFSNFCFKNTMSKRNVNDTIQEYYLWSRLKNFQKLHNQEYMSLFSLKISNRF